MTDHHDETDVLDVLRKVFDTTDPPPEHVIAHARGVFAWHGIDAELAELVYDSDTLTATQVRGADAARQVTFRAPGLEIEVEVLSERSRLIIGQLVPAQDATIELRHGDQVHSTTADGLGRFSFEGVPSGAIKLTVVTASGARIQTEGLTI